MTNHSIPKWENDRAIEQGILFESTLFRFVSIAPWEGLGLFRMSIIPAEPP